ncbi:dual specificity protein phosphatase family protein [Candidatus Babeliales bacterium]|nr:dual specificity protein phosphatase family protein [Candidatus Babeliales bacterium]
MKQILKHLILTFSFALSLTQTTTHATPGTEGIKEFLGRQNEASTQAISIKQHVYNFFDTIIFSLEWLLLAKDNFYVVDEELGLYRSRQLSPTALREYIETYGIKTVINLRGENQDQVWWQEEKKVLEEMRVNLINIPMSHTNPPTLENFKQLINAFKNASYPILFHCKSGSDRTGEATGTWIILNMLAASNEELINQALRELRLKYGHLWLAHPKKRDFIRKFGSCYLQLRDELKKHDNLDLDDKKALKALVNEAEYLEHAIAAL